MDWVRYFEMMVDWKKLPSYKAEPRIDSLIGFYLKEILEDQFKEDFYGIIPEFPLRLGTLDPKCENSIYRDRSFKVDFLGVGSKGVNYLIEFKTDSGSLRDRQHLYLAQAKNLGTKAIIEGALQIARVSTFKNKYEHLKNKMHQLLLISDKYEYSGLNPVLKIIYIQPSKRDLSKTVIEFDQVAEWLEKNYPDQDCFEKYFASTLRKWNVD